MKKIIFTLAMVVLTLGVFAQPVKTHQQNPANYKATKHILSGRETGESFANTANLLRNTYENFVGTTYYDLQSNSSMGQRIVAHDDGTVSFVWTTCGPTAATRGTGYNYYNNSSMLNSYTSTDRIENVRTGWGNIAKLGTGSNIGEIVVSHDGTTGLVISTRPAKGTGDWNSAVLVGPEITSGINTSTALLWPTLATSGNTVHLFACTDSDAGYLYQGIQTALVYYRGTYDAVSNSVTWENPRLVDGISSSYINTFEGDGYKVTVNNGKVAVLVSGSFSDVFYCESTDNGITWSRTIVFDSPVPENYRENTTLLLDTPFVSDGAGSIAIDADGNVHVAFGITRVLNTDTADGQYSYFPGYDAMLYWNSTMPQIALRVDTPAYSLDPDYLISQGRTVFSRPDLDGDGIISPYAPASASPFPSFGISLTSLPQIITDDGTVYLLFCSALEYPFVDYDQGKFYRGVFGTKSTDNGTTWNMDSISWLSYGEELYFVDWDAFHSAPEMDDTIASILFNNENIFVAVADEIINGKINMTWQADYFAGSEIKENNAAVCNNENKINWLSIDASQIGVFNNTNEVHTGAWNIIGISENSLSEMTMYPNPASDLVTIIVNSKENGQALMTVTNLMGQNVYSSSVSLSNGANQLSLNISDLSSGFYVVNIKTNKGTSTQKLIVR